MNYYRVLFVTEENKQINADVSANDLQNAIDKAKAKYHMPTGFAIYEGFKRNCKKGEKLFTSC